MISNLSVRERLIHTASQLFYEKGYANTGINEVIEKAGVAKASLYSHFRTKDDLLIAYLNEREEQLLYSLEQFVGKRKKGKDKILSVFDFLLDFYSSDEYRGCWCINTLAEIPKDNTRVKTVIRGHKKKLMTFLDQLIDENLDASEDPGLAKQIYLLYEAAVMESYLQGDNWPIQQAANITQKII
ncbi:TetR family transcriptional regulator [Leptobacterium flavescens]|uniref:TetR family transcriptional regulator n=1 Tax=Leptobacterium flavescens TaxID=472055 RepID=A0A6P0UUG6_9FLAO|nr:TetR/AcrR family transcriptional regulator [Leptobacterium flavescens]NER14453.1 TetR family transcriptional regulator [Leptobacterium flavescens]